MDVEFKSACTKYIKFRQNLPPPGNTDVRILQKMIDDMWGIINIFEKIFNTNPLVIERDSELPIEIYLFQAQTLIGALKQDRSMNEKLTQDEIQHVSVTVQLLRRILILEPFNDVRYLFANVLLYYHKYNPDYDLKNNLNLVKEVLYMCPNSFEANFHAGRLYRMTGDIPNAMMHLKLTSQIIEILPEQTPVTKAIHVLSLLELGHLYYKDLGGQQRYAALYFYQKAYNINPESPDACNCMGVIYTELREVDNALKYYEKGLQCADKTIVGTADNIKSQLYMNMGLVKSFETKYEEAIECSNNSLRCNPGLTLAYQNKMLDMNYISYKIKDPMYIAEQHFKINKMFKEMITDYKVSLPDYVVKKKDEILNIGFVSGDLIGHPVAFFMKGVLTNFDRNKIKICCYYTKSINPQIAKALYKDIEIKCVQNLSHINLANVIKNDKIDILLDLSGHTCDNRLDTFQLKPAPIQISYVGYPNTTGMKNMDYRITDKVADPPFCQKYYTEKLIYLPNCFLNYDKSETPITNKQRDGRVVFGSFNKCNKINKEVLRVWVRILKEIPNAIIALKTKEIQTKSLADQFRNNIKELQGDVDISNRIVILPYKDSWGDHLVDYNQIDYALDSFPYSGTTTTCDALHMGTPVITLFDNFKYYHSQNVSSSILKNCGLDRFITYSADEYVELAKKLARDVDKLDKNQIRKAFHESPLCDAKRFAKDFEDLLINTYHSHPKFV